MDTKLKNRHKLAIILIILVLLISTFSITSNYLQFYHEMTGWENQETAASVSADVPEELLGSIIAAAYYLYNTENETGITESRYGMEVSFPELTEAYDTIYPYLEYVMMDSGGNTVSKSTANSETKLLEEDLDDYELSLVLNYDEEGEADITITASSDEAQVSRELRQIMKENEYGESENILNIQEYMDGGLKRPCDQIFYFAMTEENLQACIDSMETPDLEITYPQSAVEIILFFMVLTAAAALILPMFRSLRTGEEKIFGTPLEVVLIVSILVITMILAESSWMFQRNRGYADVIDFGSWFLFFAVIYWLTSCLRQLYILGPEKFVKERTLLGPSWKQIRRNVSETCRKWYDAITEIDLTDSGNRIIIKIVVVNFLFLSLVSILWLYGIIVLALYSAVLFVLIQKFYRDLRDKYARLLAATNSIAEGDLNTEITEDLGLFNPVKSEIEKIQTGFRKAVEEEVKSQRMKTELVTNVSHDLKTPLTAIITYVDLLKNEKDPDKQQEYIQVLEKKSLRLKVLIQDLFDISKANSEDVKLDLMEVDLVDLFKQVKLEQEDQFRERNLDFRCSYPNEKLMVWLDSEKTCRIFENLLVNIGKYALPGTRVYVEIAREEETAAVRMKNISAAELHFTPDELTERFVRGDASRNTEGSGLGLAIVKSFTELQKGELKIETEADLFKVEIRFRNLC